MRKLHWIDILTVLFIAFVIYGSLIPFDFVLDPKPPEGPTFLNIPIGRSGLPDVMANIALYLPLGLLLHGYLHRRGLRLVGIVASVITVAGAMSVCLEFAQTFLTSRFSSMSDVVCNIIGAGMGVALGATESAIGRRFGRALDRELVREPAAVIAGGFCVVVAVVAWLPLDLTFDRSVIGRALREAWFVPFERHAALRNEVNQATLDMLPTSYEAARDLWQLRLDYVGDVLLFMVLGALMLRYLRRRRGDRPMNVLQACVFTIAPAVVITAGGLFVGSVGFDVTHIVTRSVGGVLGVLLYDAAKRLLVGRGERASWLGELRTQRALMIGIVVCGAYIAGRGLAPFRFDDTRALTKMESIEWLPMQSYSLAKVPQAALDASHKLARYLTLGSLLAFWWLSNGRRVGWTAIILSGVLAASGTVLLECAQCWLPGRFPSVTDVLLGGGATSGGVFLGAIMWGWYGRTRTAGAADGASAVVLNVEIPPPSADAPVEVVAKQPPVKQ